MEKNDNYPGDSAWFDFIDALRPMWDSYPRKADLICALSGNEDLAVAAYFAAGEQALDWVERTVPSLGMRTPRSLAASPKTRNVLRAMLMRVH